MNNKIDRLKGCMIANYNVHLTQLAKNHINIWATGKQSYHVA